MKHLFYIFYVLTYSGAVFAGGLFVGQLLARSWWRRDERARLEATAPRMEPSGVGLRDAEAAERAAPSPNA
jgi:hypothetical protein